jgi:large subunit ribosomal protein L15
MHDFDIHAPKGANKKKRILGRGQGSGRGTTAGKGNTGQQSRSGGKTYLGFEGGQMPLYRRLAHRGFSNYPFRKTVSIVNVGQLESAYTDGETVDIATLLQKGLIKKVTAVKILSDGELTKKLVIACPVSDKAKEKIEKAGGSING